MEFDIRMIESRAHTYFQNLTPQESSGWDYTGLCYFDIDKDLVIGEFTYLGEPRTKEVSPYTVLDTRPGTVV